MNGQIPGLAIAPAHGHEYPDIAQLYSVILKAIYMLKAEREDRNRGIPPQSLERIYRHHPCRRPCGRLWAAALWWGAETISGKPKELAGIKPDPGVAAFYPTCRRSNPCRPVLPAAIRSSDISQSCCVNLATGALHMTLPRIYRLGISARLPKYFVPVQRSAGHRTWPSTTVLQIFSRLE